MQLQALEEALQNLEANKTVPAEANAAVPSEANTAVPSCTLDNIQHVPYFTTAAEFLEFIPGSWEEDGWVVEASLTPAKVCVYYSK